MFSLMKGEKGFTLIEIMVVLVILGVLATISVPMYTKSVRKAKISEAIGNIGSYGTAIRIYRMEKGTWPPSKTDTNPPQEDGEDALDIVINELYFEITWTKPGDDAVFTILVTSTKFDETGTFEYDIDPTTYKGSWWNKGDPKLLTKYASYLEAGSR